MEKGQDSSTTSAAQVIEESRIQKHSTARYDAAYWARHRGRRQALWDYASALDEVLDPSSVLDVGCGPGYMLEWFLKEYCGPMELLGLDAQALPLHEYADDWVASYIQPTMIDDWTEDEPDLGHYDLVICTNVFSTVPEEKWHLLARKLAEAGDYVFFLPWNDSWRRLFRDTAGYERDDALTKAWRRAVTSEHKGTTRFRKKAAILTG